MDAGLQGKTVLVTGASGGIGLVTAEALAAEGASLVLHYHRNADPLHALAQRLTVPHAIVQADLSNESETSAMFARALSALPRIDAIVVNAGVWEATPAPLHEMSLEQWRRTLDVDLTGAFLTCRAFLRHLAEVPRKSASIVLVGSTAAIFGETEHADYATAKAGMVHGLGLSLKNEIVRLTPRGRVNSVCPGWTRTPMADEQLKDKALVARVQATMPMRKIGEAYDVAAAIVFLVSDRLSGHLSGTILPIAGGMEGRLLNDPHAT